jgi:hypothetical protein
VLHRANTRPVQRERYQTYDSVTLTASNLIDAISRRNRRIEATQSALILSGLRGQSAQSLHLPNTVTHTSRHRPSPRTRMRGYRAPRKGVSMLAATGAFMLIALFAIAPPSPPTSAEVMEAALSVHAQSLTVSARAATESVSRDGYSLTSGPASLATSGTNYDWAALVLVSGGWPTTAANVTVFVRWMRQENGADNWWNRNNPMNNGYGSGGGGGTGSYANLIVAAQKAAENLQRNPSFSAIVAALASSAPAEVTEQAIWASPWASGHYGNGSRWHRSPVAVVKAPASAW